MATGHLNMVPPYVEPKRRSLAGDVTTGVRWICFLIFLASFLVVIPTQSPSQVSFQKLIGDVQAGRASSIGLESASTSSSDRSSVTVRWKTGPFSWNQTTQNFLTGSGTPPPGALAAFQVIATETSVSFLAEDGMSKDVTATSPDAHGWSGTADQIRSILAAAAQQSGHNVDVGTYTKHDVLFFNLGESGAWEPLVVVAGFLWLATFIGMLVTRDHRYATRWAWFWLFVIGGVGPLLILWKEPVPLRLKVWQRNDDHLWTQAPISGGTGFVYALGWTILIVVAGSGLSWLASP